MSSLTRRACYKCGNIGHYAGTAILWMYLEGFQAQTLMPV